MTFDKLILPALGLLSGVTAYAMDWQREQDQKINDLNILIEKQQTLLELQVKYNTVKELERLPSIEGAREDVLRFNMGTMPARMENGQ